MRSIRKISLLVAMVAAAIAVTAPAAASAAKIEAPAGQMMAPGALLSMSNKGNVTFQTSWGLLSCKEVTLPAELILNDGVTVKTLGGLGSAKTCNKGSSSFILEPELRGMTLNSPTSGTMDLKIKADFGNNLKCVYENTATPVTYTAGTNVLRITNGNLKATPAACGPFLINAELSISKLLGGTPVLY